MVDERRAVRAWEAHLEEVIGVEGATTLADRFERFVTREYLDAALEEQTERLTARIGDVEGRLDSLSERIGRLEVETGRLKGELTASWRRDLLLISVGQFFALAGAVAALVTLGG